VAIFHPGLMNPEGPVRLADGSWLIVEMHESRGWVCRISADGRDKTVLARTGRPNGLAVDRDGTIWVAESMNPPSLLRMTLDGRFEQFLSECDGEKFLFPNDLAFGPDGALYMTDSGVKRSEILKVPPENRAALPTDGRVFRIDTRTRDVRRLANGLQFANGLAFSAGSALFVGSTNDGKVWRFPWRDNGSLGPREFFADVLDPAKKAAFRGPDGMKFGQDGNLYCTVVWQGDVAVIAPTGRIVERIALHGNGPTNLAFGAPGERRIYVTEQGTGAFEVHDVGCDGLPLCTGPGS
jgi:gluconolactonase